MARGTKNSLSNPTTTLTAPIVAGVTDSVSVVLTTEMPSDGITVFSVNIGNTSADQEIIDATYNGTTLNFQSIAQKNHTSGDPVNIVWSEADYNNFVKKDSASDLAALPVSTAQAAADALKVSKSGDTMTGQLIVPSGTAAAPAIRVGGSGEGIYGLSSVVAIATSGAGRLSINSTGITVVGGISFSAGMRWPLRRLTGVTYGMSLTADALIQSAANSSGGTQLLLPKITSATLSTFFLLIDPSNLLAANNVTITPSDDGIGGFSEYDTINGQANTAIGGADFVANTNGATYLIASTGDHLDPLGYGASGYNWIAQRISA